MWSSLLFGTRPGRRCALALLLAIATLACSNRPERHEPPEQSEQGNAAVAHERVFLITLDTVRGDALGHEGGKAETPVLDRLAAEGVRFAQAYSSAPTTLPAHTSMLTGLYPAAHGIHENGRRVGSDLELLAGRLKAKGYATAAFVSGYPLERRFGLDRGFDHYDDDFASGIERDAAATTDRVLGYLEGRASGPLFVWVHYYDAHEPYLPPEPFAARWRESPYFGEVAFVDSQLSRLLEGLLRSGEPPVLLVAGDHGEGLGDHGETLHGNLLYQGVMRVPLAVWSPNLEARTVSRPVSTRRIFQTVLALAGEEISGSLLGDPDEVVVAEAMKPYLQYGWQPQVMAVSGALKAILSGESIELYDVVADPAETVDLSSERRPSPALLQALREYPLPAEVDSRTEALDEDERRKLAALGYFASTERPALDPEAPRARDMTHLFADLDLGSGLFVEERWPDAISVFDRILREDPKNLMVTLRLAAAHSFAGRREAAERAFEVAERIAPDSVDRRRYLALHHCRFGALDRAEPLLESIRAQVSGNLPALECLVEIRLRHRRFAEAATLLESVATLRPGSAAVQKRLGEARMALGETESAIAAFETARRLEPNRFDRQLELGVLYLSARQLDRAAEALDSVPPAHRQYPMALFKRAQVSVLRGEADREERVRRAYRHADTTTRPLIANESLFRGFDLN